MLGQAAMGMSDWSVAIAAFRRALELRPDGFTHFEHLASAQYAAAMLQDVLMTVAEAEAQGTFSWPLAFNRARALKRLGRTEAAIASARSSVELSAQAHEAAEVLLRWMCEAGDGGALLDACEALPEAHRRGAAYWGYRAVALDLLGRREEAGALMDLDRHVVRCGLEPAGGAARFNGRLAEEILRDAAPFATPGADDQAALGNTTLDASDAYRELSPWLRAEVERRLESASDPLAKVAPASGYLLCRAYVFRRRGHVGLHLHSAGVVAGVYHVQTPGDLAGNAGCLMLGLAPPELPEYRPSWPIRRVRPDPGTLTLFPPYVFHDFVPTGSNEPRIAIGVDLRAHSEEPAPVT
jgi:tetratricopeptide (TPR) repeat protein